MFRFGIYAALCLLLIALFTGCGSSNQTVTTLDAQPSTGAPSGLSVVVKNQNTSYNDSNVYISFRNAVPTGTINGQAIQQNQAYSISQIGSGIVLQSFEGGRIYFSLGAPLTGSADPEFINPNIVNYNIRFDKIEMSYATTDPTGTADLTAIDFFGIPLEMKTFTTNSSTPQQTLTYTVPGNTVINTLGAMTGNNSSVVLRDSQNNFLRVLGTTHAPGTYPSFQPYIDSVRSSGTSVQIQDLFSRAGNTTPTTTQCYKFATSFDASGNIHLTGGGSSYNGGPTVGPGHEIIITYANLIPGVYSANPDYTVDGAPAHIADNDVYAAATRDVLAAFGFGFMNTSTIDPNTNQPFTSEPSTYWWRSPKAFAFLQPNNPYYNQYAAYLYSISSAYGQPFSDRWQKVLADLPPSTITKVEIDILPDSGTVSDVPNAGSHMPPISCVP